MSGKGSKALVGRDLNAKARRLQALELRIEGRSQQDIADALGVSQPQVSRMIRQALREREVQSADELRAIESERIDAVHQAMWRRATENGDVGAAHVILKASDRRGKLLGLDQGGEGGIASRHDYLVYGMVDITEAASDELARWEAETRRKVAGRTSPEGLLPERLVVDTAIPLDVSDGKTWTDAVRDVVFDAANAIIGPRSPDAPPLVFHLIILDRHYFPATGGRGPQPVN